MRFALITAAALSAGLLVGCKDDKTTTTTPRPTPSATRPSVTDDLEGAATRTGDAATKTAEDAQDAAGDAIRKATEGAEDAAGKAKEGAAKLDNATEGANPEMAAKTKADAQKYHDQAMAAVKEKDFAAAEAALEKLEAMKAQLSTEWQTKVESLKSTMEKSKKAGDVKIPGDNE